MPLNDFPLKMENLLLSLPSFLKDPDCSGESGQDPGPREPVKRLTAPSAGVRGRPSAR